jgi:hypothetical protein
MRKPTGRILWIVKTPEKMVCKGGDPDEQYERMYHAVSVIYIRIYEA